MLTTQTDIINILPNQVKEAYNFLILKKVSEKELQCAIQAIGHLLKFEPDTETLLATILFRIPNIKEKDLHEIKNQFGKEVSNIVKDLLKFSRISFAINTSEKRKTFIQKALLVLSNDIRALYIKLATRLAKLQIELHPVDISLKDLALEALELHAPLADILGLWNLKAQIEDTAFKHLHPEEYQKILLYRSHKKSINEEYIKKIEKTISSMAKTLEMSHTIEVKLKHLHEIYLKRTRRFNSNSLKDILAFQIITPSKRDCYRMLGIIHSIWKPQHKSLKDYIAIPKMNSYQAIHTTVFGPDERICLFQITTPDLMRKRNVSILKDQDLNKNAYKWLKSNLESGYESDAQLLVSGLKNNSLEKSIFIFTNKGNIINLPKQSTPIDAAYNISSYTGNHYLKAYVNGIQVEPYHKLQTGDTVKVITSKSTSGPQLDWIEHIRTEEAKSGIQKYFQKKSPNEQRKAGSEKLEKIIKKVLNVNLRAHQRILEKKIKNKTNFKNLDAVFILLGRGEIKAKKLLKELYSEEELVRQIRMKNTGSKDKNLSQLRLIIRCENVTGMLNAITKKVVDLEFNIIKVSTKLDNSNKTATISIGINVKKFEKVYRLIEELENTAGILEVNQA